MRLLHLPQEHPQHVEVVSADVGKRSPASGLFLLAPFRRWARAVNPVVGPGHGHIADRPAADHLRHDAVGGDISPLISRCQDETGRLCRIHHQPRILGRIGQWLLAQHVKPGFQRSDSLLVVQPGRRSDPDCIDA
jgi:hypothetical protein